MLVRPLLQFLRQSPLTSSIRLTSSKINSYSCICRTTELAKRQLFSRVTDEKGAFLVSGSAPTYKSIHTTPSNLMEEDRKTTAITIFKDLHKVRHSPLPALTLGLSGLIPFMAIPGSMIFMQTYCSELAFAQVAYGATILSFLGGIRWGLTLHSGGHIKPDWHNLGYSVVPSLVAWTGLMLPHTFSALTLIGGLGSVAYFDTIMSGYPDWFKALRFILSFFAILSLWTTLICKYLLNDKKSDDAGKSKHDHPAV